MRRKNSLILLIAIAGWAICGTSYADSVIGSPGAGLQSWTVSFNNLNTNFAPYWDYSTTYQTSNLPGFPPFLTSPPRKLRKRGVLPDGNDQLSCAVPQAWPAARVDSILGLPYDSVTDTGGDLDLNFFFKKDGPNERRATLEFQLSTRADEIKNRRFETDSTGSTIVPFRIRSLLDLPTLPPLEAPPPLPRRSSSGTTSKTLAKVNVWLRRYSTTMSVRSLYL